MGKIAKQSFERGFGTIIGGWLGYAAYIISKHPSPEEWAECWTAIVSILFAFCAFLIGVKLQLDYSGKLLGISFVLGKASASTGFTSGAEHSPKLPLVPVTKN